MKHHTTCFAKLSWWLTMLTNAVTLTNVSWTIQMWYGNWKHLTLPCFAFISSPCCRAEVRDDMFEEIGTKHAYFLTLQTPCTVRNIACIESYEFLEHDRFIKSGLRFTCHVLARGVATGGISVYIPPKSVTVLFTCGTLTHVLKLQWLLKTYTPPPKSNSSLRHWF